MLPALEADDPWALNYWLARGWRAGIAQARFAPDTVEIIFNEVTKIHLNYCRRLYRDCVVATADGNCRPNLEAAFERYIAESKDCHLHVPEIRALNLRLLAARGYDFTVWMGFISGMPQSSNEARGT